MTQQQTYSFGGFGIPVDLLCLTGGGPDTFDAISKQHIAHIEKHIGISASDSIVEIGCGIGRDAIPLTSILEDKGRYVGIDIIRPSIEWCTENITARHQNFSFHWFNVADKLHNPGGDLPISACRIPADEESVDLIILQSVFTHMFEDGILFYLKEFARVMKRRAKIYATCFIVDEVTLAAVSNAPVTIYSLSFLHHYQDGCYINSIDYPTGAVAFTLPKLHEMINAAGLRFSRPALRGTWSGVYPDADGGQDTIILEKM